MSAPSPELRDNRVRRFAARSLAGAVAACLSNGCATPSYARFYDRYAGKCAVSSPPPSAARETSAAIPDAFVQAVNDQDAKLRECYVASLHYGETHGKIRFHIELRPDGRVEPVTLVSDKTSFPPLACCVEAVVRELHVKTPTAVSLEYTFWFRTMRARSSLGMGIPLTHSGATRRGYLAEMDESSVVIGGLLLYPLAPDHLHYYTDVEESDATSQGKDTGSATSK